MLFVTIPDFTIVLGVDAKHLEQLALVWPTWMKHKPSLRDRPLLIFYDREQVRSLHEIRSIVGKNHPGWRWQAWPPKCKQCDGEGTTRSSGSVSSCSKCNGNGIVRYPEGHDKFSNQQRYKMLAGFIHVAAEHVTTPYWLKLDTDTVAVGCRECCGLGWTDDPMEGRGAPVGSTIPCSECDGRDTRNWIDPAWFDDTPGIVAHPWAFTKPADQMMVLDQWVEDHQLTYYKPALFHPEPLNIIPKPGWSRVRHKRIISWCGFFNTELTRRCADAATKTCGVGQLPVASQDGFMWYAATRLGYPVVRANMAKRGWKHQGRMSGIRKAVEESMR